MSHPTTQQDNTRFFDALESRVLMSADGLSNTAMVGEYYAHGDAGTDAPAAIVANADVGEQRKKPLLIVAEDVEGEASADGIFGNDLLIGRQTDSYDGGVVLDAGAVFKLQDVNLDAGADAATSTLGEQTLVTVYTRSGAIAAHATGESDGHEAIWMDLGFPVQTGPNQADRFDGKYYVTEVIHSVGDTDTEDPSAGTDSFQIISAGEDGPTQMEDRVVDWHKSQELRLGDNLRPVEGEGATAVGADAARSTGDDRGHNTRAGFEVHGFINVDAPTHQTEQARQISITQDL